MPGGSAGSEIPAPPRPAARAPQGARRVPAPAPPHPVPSGGHPHRGWRVVRRARSPSGGGDGNRLPISARPAARRGECQQRRAVLPPPARAGGWPCLAGAFFPRTAAPLRHSGTAGRAGGWSACRPPPVKWSPRLDSSPSSRWVRTLPVARPAPPALRDTLLSPRPLHFSVSGVSCARVGEERAANAFRGLQARRQGESLMPTRDLGEPVPKRGTVERSAVPREVAGGPCVRTPAREGGAVCERA